jgi:hypothetical protein
MQRNLEGRAEVSAIPRLHLGSEREDLTEGTSRDSFIFCYGKTGHFDLLQGIGMIWGKGK